MDLDSVISGAYVIDVPDGSPASELDSRLLLLDPKIIRTASAIVFRVHEGLKLRLSGPDDADARRHLLGRVAIPLGLVTYSTHLNTHQLWSLSAEGCRAIELESAVSMVRRNGLRQLVDDASGYCYLTSTNTYHFITPSNRHTSVFLRVADSLTSTDVLDQYAFWLMPCLGSADLVLVDNWSIAAIIVRALQLLNSPAYFECFSAHPLHDRVSAEATIDRLLMRRTPDSQLVWVVSVTGSGTVTDLVLALLRARGLVLDPNAITSIFAFANTPAFGTVLCQLPTALEHFPSYGDCPQCLKNVPALTIDQHGYYLKAEQEIDATLSPELVAIHLRPFLATEGVESALRLHRSDPNDGRHHGFDIDVKTLLDQAHFRTRLVEAARRLPKPDVVLAPDHEPGRLMAHILAEATGSEVSIANRLHPLSGLSEVDQQRLRMARNLLIVDDVINSGSRLAAYLDGIRRNFSNKETLNILVGILRTDSATTLREIRKTLKSPSWDIKLEYIEKLFIPAWDHKICPWCQELSFLAGIMHQIAVPPEWLVRRVGELRSRTGVTSPLLLLPETVEPTLAPTSFVAPGGTSSLCLSFHLASALQNLRSDIELGKRLMPEFPNLRIFAAHNLTRYSEPLLRALFLRLIRPVEWGTTNRKKVRQELVTYLSDGLHDILLGEVLLGIYRGIIAPFGQVEFDTWFGRKLGPILPVVRDALRIPSGP